MLTTKNVRSLTIRKALKDLLDSEKLLYGNGDDNRALLRIYLKSKKVDYGYDQSEGALLAALIGLLKKGGLE